MHKMKNSSQPVEALNAPLSARVGTKAARIIKRAEKEKPFTQIRKHTIHIILVDTHVLMLMALQRVVASFPQVKIVGHLQTLREVLELVEKVEVDVIVLGISISVSDCLQFTHAVSERFKHLGIVVIQPYLRPETAFTLVKQGVHGLLDESASEQDLADAIATVATGSTFFSKGAREMLAASMSRTAIYLTARELEVASLLMHGESNFRIAQALGLKEKTVEAHLTNIYSKLSVNSRAEAIICLQDLRV
jgi:two-component system, NarL family, response regulator LiaR